jgi:chaperonin GroEL (HSP60 family)
LAVASFAEALMEIPICLALNNGLDVNSTIGELTKKHAEGFIRTGVGPNGCDEAVCTELSEVKASIIKRAYEATTLMLRVDEQISYKQKETPKWHK